MYLSKVWGTPIIQDGRHRWGEIIENSDFAELIVVQSI